MLQICLNKLTKDETDEDLNLMKFNKCLIVKLNLLDDSKCDGLEQALPARDCFNDDILADNCL